MRRLLVLPTAALLLATAACGGGSSSDSGSKASSSPSTSSSSSLKGLTVGGSFGSAPTVAVKPAVAVKTASSEIVSKGTGATVKSGNTLSLNLLIANGATGKTAVSTYTQKKPISATMTSTKFFPSVVKALTGVPVGSRVAFADTVTDLYGASGATQLGLKPADTLIFVIDVMSVTKVLDGPQGASLKAPAGAPAIVEKGTDISRLDFSKAKKPTGKLQVIQLVKGTGKALSGSQNVTLDYIGQVFGAKQPFNNTYGQTPATFGIGSGAVIKGWDNGLKGQKIGSRVMLIIPPSQGYGKAGNSSIKVTGKSTLVFVIDILGVS